MLINSISHGSSKIQIRIRTLMETRATKIKTSTRIMIGKNRDSSNLGMTISLPNREAEVEAEVSLEVTTVENAEEAEEIIIISLMQKLPNSFLASLKQPKRMNSTSLEAVEVEEEENVAEDEAEVTETLTEISKEVEMIRDQGEEVIEIEIDHKQLIRLKTRTMISMKNLKNRIQINNREEETDETLEAAEAEVKEDKTIDKGRISSSDRGKRSKDGKVEQSKTLILKSSRMRMANLVESMQPTQHKASRESRMLDLLLELLTLLKTLKNCLGLRETMKNSNSSRKIKKRN